MNTLEAWSVKITTNEHSIRVPADSWSVRGFRQRKYRLIGDLTTLDESNSLEFWQLRKSLNRIIRQVETAAQINVANAIAALHQLLDAFIRNIPAVPKMHVVQVFAELGYGMHCDVGYVSALGKNKISQSRSHLNDLFHGGIGKLGA